MYTDVSEGNAASVVRWNLSHCLSKSTANGMFNCRQSGKKKNYKDAPVSVTVSICPSPHNSTIAEWILINNV